MTITLSLPKEYTREQLEFEAKVARYLSMILNPMPVLFFVFAFTIPQPFTGWVVIGSLIITPILSGIGFVFFGVVYSPIKYLLFGAKLLENLVDEIHFYKYYLISMYEDFYIIDFSNTLYICAFIDNPYETNQKPNLSRFILT